ncbi:hypothetical protein HZB60_04215 [candidate division KSB1 bacterium]|nr:hypothetical protein [candidate division KSB1 bacterium]
MQIEVARGAGDRPGPDIVDSLLTDMQAGFSRGMAELDDGMGLQTVRLTVVIRPALRPGLLIEVSGALQGSSWRGQIVNVEHRFENLQAVSILEVKRL